VVPAFDVGATLRYRFVELTLDAGLGLSSSTNFIVGGGVEAPTQGTGSLSASLYDVAIGLGVAPHLGPGRALADVVFGVGILSVAPSGSNKVFQEESATAVLPFSALRLGYTLDLPLGLFLTARGEERLARTASFQVVGLEPDTGPATSPRLVFQGLALVGFHFF